MEHVQLTAGSLSEKLKSETAALHQKTESIALSALMMSDNLTIGKYTEYLCRLYPVHLGFEKIAFPLLSSIFPDISDRKKAPLILNDIRRTRADYSVDSAYLSNESLPFLVGYMYVLEGSVLGGRHLVKNAEKVLGEAVKGRTEYFRVYGEEIGSRWKAFISRVNEYGAKLSGAAQKEAVNGAMHAFQDVGAALQTPATAHEGHC